MWQNLMIDMIIESKNKFLGLGIKKSRKKFNFFNKPCNICRV